MKRFLTLAIIASLAMSYTVPVMAIQENNDNKAKTKVERIKPTANKFEYVNLDWWNGFNDKLMTGYIVKAIENNKDLKMASLTIDEFYQNMCLLLLLMLKS